MPLIDGFPAVSGAADQFEVRKDLAGLVVRNSSGVPRTGVFYRNSTTLLTARADMGIDIAGFEGVSLRSDGVILNSHYGTSAPGITLDAAPVANSRIDLIYFKQNETAAPSSDATDGPIFGFVKGTAAASPTKPALTIDGAVELGTVQIPSTATATNSAGVVITTTAQFTATTGGIVVCRNSTELAAWTPGDGSFSLTLSDSAFWQRVSGAWRRVLSPGTPYAMAAGIGSNPAGAATLVTFPAGRFTVAPIVVASNTNSSVSVMNIQAITSANCSIGGYNTVGTGIATNWMWMAIQMTPTSAAG